MQVIFDYDEKVNDLSYSGYAVNIEKYLGKGLDIFRQNAPLFLLFTALYMFLLPVGGFIINGPLIAGYFLVAHRLDKNKGILFENFFDGFQFFLPLFLYTVVSGLLISIGYLAFILPGIYLTVAYIFVPFFIVWGKKDFWEAMEMSRRVVTREWFSIFGLILILIIINLLGALAFGVGLLFSIPISYCAVYAAFDDIVGVPE